MWPFILVGLGLGGLALASRNSKESAMTPARRIVFQTALAKDPPLSGAQFYALAKAFDSYGLTAEADILRKRGRIRSLPQAELDKLEEAFKAGLSSKDPVQVRALANAMETEGLFTSARKLRDVANGLDVAHVVAQQAEAAQANTDMHNSVSNMPTDAQAQAYNQANPNPSPIASVADKAVAAAASVLPAQAADLLQSHASDIANAAQSAAPAVEQAASQALGSIF